MDRRFLIKQLILLTGGVLLFPSCLRSGEDHIIEYNNFDLNEGQLLLMAKLSELIIPLKENLLARDEQLHLFVIKMVDECLMFEEQKYFFSGIKELQSFIDEKYNSSLSADFNKDIELITKLERQEFGSNITNFYKIFKQQLINGYLNSAYFMTHVIEYKLIPGNYQVHVSVI